MYVCMQHVLFGFVNIHMIHGISIHVCIPYVCLNERSYLFKEAPTPSFCRNSVFWKKSVAKFIFTLRLQ